MKKFSFLLSAIVVVFSMLSCAPEVNKEAVADLDSSIVKMNRFNDQFAVFYEDTVITTVDTIEGVTCEYEDLMDLANDYLSSVIKVNTIIQEDKERVDQGGKSNGYEKSFQDALANRKMEYDAAYELFTKNMEIVDGSVEDVDDATETQQATQVQ